MYEIVFILAIVFIHEFNQINQQTEQKLPNKQK